MIYEGIDHLHHEITIKDRFLGLKELQRRTGKKIIILYLGDWDPDGDIIDEELVEYFDRFGERYGHLDYHFERIAILKEHETAFGIRLPSDPDANMHKKNKAGNMCFLF